MKNESEILFNNKIIAFVYKFIGTPCMFLWENMENYS